MEPNKPKFRFRLNLFDSIVLVLALAVGAFLVWSAIKPAAATVEDGVDMLITVEGTGLVSESGRYTLNRVYELGVNSSRTFCTKYAEFIGTVTEIF